MISTIKLTLILLNHSWVLINNWFIENSTGPLQETKVKQEDTNINLPPVQRDSLVSHSISINNTSDKERIDGTEIYNSEDNKANTNKSQSTRSNTTTKDIIEKLKNITLGGEEEEKSQDTKNVTKHPKFLISSRSQKIGGKYKVKIINRNEDYGRDCFDDLKDDMGSQGKL